MSQYSSNIGSKIRYKIVLLGDQAVGKTSMIDKFINDRFDATGSPTVGIDFVHKNINYRNRLYKLQLWDTAGQQRYRSLIPTYLKDAHCAVLVYDTGSRSSFLGIDRWVTMYKEHIGDGQFAILVGNKIDLPNREVSRAEAESKARELKLEYLEVSAKTGKKLEELFYLVIDMISTRLLMEAEADQLQPQPQQIRDLREKLGPNQKQTLKKQRLSLKESCC